MESVGRAPSEYMGYGGGVIILVTCVGDTPAWLSGFGSSVVVKGGGRTLLVTWKVGDVEIWVPVSSTFQTSITVVVTTPKLAEVIRLWILVSPGGTVSTVLSSVLV